MLAEEQAVLLDILSGLRQLAQVNKGVTDEATLSTQIFLLVQKTRYLLGEKDDA